jgi:PPIC-type PPIASE domain
MTNRLGIAALFLVSTALLPGQDGSTASRPSPEYLDAVAAKVNRKVITKSDVDKELRSSGQRLAPSDYEIYYRQKLIRLVFGAIEQDAVEEVGLKVPKRYILEQVEQEKEKKGAAEVAAGIREAGYKSEEEYVEALGKNASGQTYIAAQAGQFAGKAEQFRPDYWTEPTATEIRRYYRQHLADQFTQKDQARLYAILLPYSAFIDPVTKDAASGKAEAHRVAGVIREEIARGTALGDLARKYGRPIKSEEGGDLGWVDADSAYQKELVEFALKGPVRQLSEPILYPTPQTARAIVLAWVSERVEERVMPFSEAQSKIRDLLRAQRVEAARKKIVQKMVEDAFIFPKEVKSDLLRPGQQ